MSGTALRSADTPTAVAPAGIAIEPQSRSQPEGTTWLLSATLLLAALAYFILPFDLIPDMIAGLGFADDAALLTAVIGLVAAHITPAHRAAAARALDKELPPKS